MFCHYSLKSINFNFREKLTFFWQKFKLVLYVYCAAFATIVRQSKMLVYNFMSFQISQVNIPRFIPNFAHWFLDMFMRLVQKISSIWIFWSYYYFKSYLEKNVWSIDDSSFFRHWTSVWLILAFWIQRNSIMKNLIDKD